MMSWVGIDAAVEITNNRVQPFKGERQYLATGDLSDDGVDGLVAVDYESKPSRADLLVDEGDLVVARMKATNKVLLIENAASDFIVSTGFLTLKPKQEFNARYLYHYFRSSNFQVQKDRYCSGATQKAINNTAFYELKVPKCSLTKQVEIAGAFDVVERLRQKRGQSLKLFDDFLRATFFKMFGDSASNGNGWPVKSLGEISNVKIGPFGSLLHKEDYIPNGVPLVNPTHIVNMKICPDFNLSISDQKRKELQAYLLKTGDVILARRGEIGRCGLITDREDGYLCGTGSIFVRPQRMLNSMFLVYLLSSQSMRQTLENLAVGVTMKNLNAGIVEGLNIICPDKALQDRFALLVANVESLKEKMETSSGQMNNQFNALVQRYFD